MTTRELGELGEKIACEYLVKKEYKILAKNYRISFGEIDIIARKKFSFFARNNKTIHFIEVKALLGTNENFAPEERVNYKKQQKLKRMAEIWLEKNKYRQSHPYQIDVVGILVDENARKAKIHYFPNAVGDK